MTEMHFYEIVGKSHDAVSRGHDKADDRRRAFAPQQHRERQRRGGYYSHAAHGGRAAFDRMALYVVQNGLLRLKPVRKPYHERHERGGKQQRKHKADQDAYHPSSSFTVPASENLVFTPAVSCVFS